MLAFALQQVKTKYRSGITQADKDAYHTWLCLASESTGSGLPRDQTFRKVRMPILLGAVFASNFVFTWVIPIAFVCACISPCACVASENHVGFISLKLTATTVIISWYL